VAAIAWRSAKSLRPDWRPSAGGRRQQVGIGGLPQSLCRGGACGSIRQWRLGSIAPSLAKAAARS